MPSACWVELFAMCALLLRALLPLSVRKLHVGSGIIKML